ncbi:conserved Plasmodium protein, unknown function [Plasmodium gallinaceum]|uniref:Uncharacterized protein n=1 Tax=Plasmodium gallinaceum TaxID=5849 RepID=A0A1J1GXB0_PLAGA|nr:conserved Plasmodium protein, unknown function [Plasmodium gallinaceum]CRG95656.1 conserved Plasmodium protein, unknown function [Plasmodium gallinaceum]
MANDYLELFNEINSYVDISSFETHQLTNKPLFLIKNERKFLFLAREPYEYKLDHLYKDIIEVTENIKRNLINENIHTILFLYIKILKEIRIHKKYKRGIDEKVEKVIISAIKLYSLKERQNENIKKYYIKKICSICNSLSKILVQYKRNSENILKNKPSSCDFDDEKKNFLTNSNSFQNNFFKCNIKNTKLNENNKNAYEGIKEKKVNKTVDIEKEKELPFKNKINIKNSNSSELLNNYRKLYNPSKKLKKLNLKKNFTLINSIRCLYSAKELNDTNKDNCQKEVKLFKCYKRHGENLVLGKRSNLLKKFNRFLEKKQKIIDKKKKKKNSEIQDESTNKMSSDNSNSRLRRKNYKKYQEDNDFSYIEKNISNKLKDILLNTNNTFTTFKVSSSGNIETIIQLSEDNKKKKKFIILNEYDYFFNSSTDELKEGTCKKNKDEYDYKKFFFYVGKKKIFFDKKKKEKIIFEMDENGLLKKYIFKKNKNNNDILMKVYNENEWSDDIVDFCYITKDMNKEKVVIKKNKNGTRSRIVYHESELNDKEKFNYYKRNVENIKKINFYDDDDAILYFLRKNVTKKKKIKNEDILKKKKVSDTTHTIHKKEFNSSSLKKKKQLLLYNNISEMYKESQSDILSKINERKDKFLKGICELNKEETYAIKKVQKPKNVEKQLKINNFSMREKRSLSNNKDKTKFNKLDNLFELYEKEKDENKEITNNKYILYENEKEIIKDDMKNELKKNTLNNKKVLNNKEKTKNIYDNLKKKNESKKSSMYSIDKLTTIIAKKKESNESFEKQKNTNKKIEDFVFNENLKSISVSSYNLRGVFSKQSSKISLYEKNLDLSSKSFKNKDNGIISKTSSFLSNNEKCEIIDDAFSKKNSYSFIKSFNSKDFNDISKKTSYSFIKSFNSKDVNDISKKTSYSLMNNFKDKEHIIFQTESNNIICKKYSSHDLSQLNGNLELSTNSNNEKNEKNENYNLKEKSEKIDEDYDSEKNDRIVYLSKGFSAYAHMILSETNIITRKCIISYNVQTKKLKMMRNEKIFEIDGHKLNIQEIPTYGENGAIVKLVTSKKNCNALLIESDDLVGLQHLGDEIGWYYEEKDDTIGNKTKKLSNPKEIYYKLNSNKSKKRISFFDKIKLNKFLGRKK